jgi:hypothetical protein
MKGNRSGGATFGAAFLFLSLAAVPVSMKAIGFEVRFAPTMNAVVDAWGEIASAFAAGNQPISVTDLSAVNNSSAAESPAPEAGAQEQPCMMACAKEEKAVEVESEEPFASAAEAKRPEPARSRCANTVRRAPAYKSPVMVASVRVKPEPQIDFKALEVTHALRDITLDSSLQEWPTA